MKKVINIFLLFIILACSSKSTLETYKDQVSYAINQSPVINPLGTSSLFYQDLYYGSAERNNFDLMVP